MDSPAVAVVHAYFARMRAGDPSVADLFADDAQLVGLGQVVRGRPAIRAFYEDAIRRGGPAPSLRSPLLLEGDRVAAELDIALADGSQLHVLDLFETRDGKIASLTYFLADHP